MATLDIRNFTRGPVPRSPFGKAAAAVLPGWDISLVLAGTARAQKLNQTLRGKEYVPNVLSYEVGPRSGEIIICPEIARREAPRYGHSENAHILFLFIHGLLHLKGIRHGATMERQERDLLRRLLVLPSKPNDTAHRNRNRYRNASNESRRR